MFTAVASIFKPLTYLKSIHVRMNDLLLIVESSGLPQIFEQWCKLVETQAMFTLYLTGFCSISKVAPVQCEQELIFCCVAEIVPNGSHCEQKPYPSYNLQRSILI